MKKVKGDYAEECGHYARQLRRRASQFSWTHVILTSLSGILGLALIYPFKLDGMLYFILNFIPVFCVFGVLFLRVRIENVEKYRELASEFDNLKQDFCEKGCTSINLRNLKKLRTKLAKFPTPAQIESVQKENNEWGIWTVVTIVILIIALISLFKFA